MKLFVVEVGLYAMIFPTRKGAEKYAKALDKDISYAVEVKAPLRARRDYLYNAEGNDWEVELDQKHGRVEVG